jgi:hypothetical protein
MNARTILIPLLCLGAVALAWGPRTGPASSLMANTVAPTAKTVKKQAKSVAPRVTGELVVKVEDGGVRLELDVSNTGQKSAELSFASGQTHDFAIIDRSGAEVYRWSDGRMFTQSMQNRLLDAGSTMRLSERASTTLPAGEYTAVATLRSSNYPVERRVAFSTR